MKIGWGQLTTKTKQEIARIKALNGWYYLPMLWAYGLSLIGLLKVADLVL